MTCCCDCLVVRCVSVLQASCYVGVCRAAAILASGACARCKVLSAIRLFGVSCVDNTSGSWGTRLERTEQCATSMSPGLDARLWAMSYSETPSTGCVLFVCKPQASQYHPCGAVRAASAWPAPVREPCRKFNQPQFLLSPLYTLLSTCCLPADLMLTASHRVPSPSCRSKRCVHCCHTVADTVAQPSQGHNGHGMQCAATIKHAGEAAQDSKKERVARSP